VRTPLTSPRSSGRTGSREVAVLARSTGLDRCSALRAPEKVDEGRGPKPNGCLAGEAGNAGQRWVCCLRVCARHSCFTGAVPFGALPEGHVLQNALLVPPGVVEPTLAACEETRLF